MASNRNLPEPALSDCPLTPDGTVASEDYCLVRLTIAQWGQHLDNGGRVIDPLIGLTVPALLPLAP